MATLKPHEMEEILEFTTATNMRNSLLKGIDALRESPALRFVITKNGMPEAVLLSYHTYELIKKMMNRAIADGELESREGRLRAAYNRLRSDYEANEPAPVIEAPVESDPFVVASSEVESPHSLLKAVEDLNRRIRDFSDVLQAGRKKRSSFDFQKPKRTQGKLEKLGEE